jgi:hypothetical protein
MFSRAAGKWFTIGLLATLLLAAETPGFAQVFRSDDPIRIDRDNLPIPKPARRKINDYYDFLENTFIEAGDRTVRRATNINTLGDVPDCSWFSNRIGVGRLRPGELVRGANVGSGPAAGPLTVIAGKSQGITPGFTVQDSAGETYFLKFDPGTNPEMATAAEVISSKFFHALGYNVGELYLIRFRPSDLTISPKATIRNELDEETPLTQAFINTLLAPVAKDPDGAIRAIASKLIPEGIGPFKFFGTRRDDPNDVFPHEHRRELRGYYVFCSWLNHDDSRSVNTLDAYSGADGKGFVKHYLLDFGSTLGSGSLFAQKLRPGNEYMWEAAPTFASIFSLGIWLRPWVSVKYPDFPSIGRFEGDFYRPERWKPEYPNAAFRNMDREDAFWAARLMMMFSDQDIRDVVAAGMLSDERAASYLAGTLIKRRDKTGNHWLQQVSSLDNFQVLGDALVFEDLLVKHRFAESTPPQTVRFAAFDNRTGQRSEIGSPASIRERRLSIPAAIVSSPENSFFVVTLAAGAHSVDVFLKKNQGLLKIVGLQRK